MIEGRDMLGEQDWLNGQDMLDSHDVIKSQEKSQHVPGLVIIDRPSTSSENMQISEQIIHHTKTREVDYAKLQSQKICNGPTRFQSYVVNSLIDIKNQLKLVIKNSEDLFSQLARYDKPKETNQKISQQVKAKINNIMLQLPLNDEGDLASLENTLTEEDCYACMVIELKLIGGSDMKSVVTALMRRIFSNNVGEKFSYHGKKRKQIFSDLAICKVIFEVVRLRYPDATNFDIAEPIKDWLRHAPERMKNSTSRTTSQVTSATQFEQCRAIRLQLQLLQKLLLKLCLKLLDLLIYY